MEKEKQSAIIESIIYFSRCEKEDLRPREKEIHQIIMRYIRTEIEKIIQTLEDEIKEEMIEVQYIKESIKVAEKYSQKEDSTLNNEIHELFLIHQSAASFLKRKTKN